MESVQRMQNKSPTIELSQQAVVSPTSEDVLHCCITYFGVKQYLECHMYSNRRGFLTWKNGEDSQEAEDSFNLLSRMERILCATRGMVLLVGVYREEETGNVHHKLHVWYDASY